MLVLSGRSMEAIAKGRPKTTSCMFEFDSRCGIASATFLPASPSAAKPTPIITQVEGSGTAPPTAGDEVISERERRVRIGRRSKRWGANPFGRHPLSAATVSACRCRWNGATYPSNLGLTDASLTKDGASIVTGVRRRAPRLWTECPNAFRLAENGKPAQISLRAATATTDWIIMTPSRMERRSARPFL